MIKGPSKVYISADEIPGFMNVLSRLLMPHIVACVTICPGLDGEDTSYVKFEMPTRALMLLDLLKSGEGADDDHSTSESGRRVCSFADVQRAAPQFELSSSLDFIKSLLGIFSALGAVSWFPEADESLVVLDPQWLLDSMACLIREHEGEHSNLLKELTQDGQAVDLDEEIVKCGYFPIKLLEYVW